MTINLDLNNVQAAIDALEKNAKDLEDKAKEITYRVASVGADEVVRVDGEDVVSWVEPTKDGHSMIAQSPAIVFLEFGTGARTESDAPYADKVSVNVYPGSWSEEHENTWAQWIEGGGDPEKYRYNRYPKRGMYLAAQRMKREVKDIAKAVFSDE